MGEHGQPVTVVFSPDAAALTLPGTWTRRGRRAAARQVAVQIDEIGIMARGNSTAPNLCRVLHHGRRSKITMNRADPRPAGIGPLDGQV